MEAINQTKINKKQITIAVAGNPNSGKSTLINSLAGTRLQVGNWPGVTVEKKEAILSYDNTTVRIVDLPGTYSLSPYSQEEIIARDFLINEKPDVIVNVVDATNLERNLYLTVQLLELGIPVIMALNMMDECEKLGYRIDVNKLEQLLGVTVVKTVATRSKGVEELRDILFNSEANWKKFQKIHFSDEVETAINELSAFIKENKSHELSDNVPIRWLATKLIEEDANAITTYGLDAFENKKEEVIQHLIQNHGDDPEALLADERYGLASGVVHEVLKKPVSKKFDLTERIDKVVLNKYLGLPIFFLAMWLVFKFTFDVSTPFVDWIDEMTAGPFARWSQSLLSAISTPEWFISLFTDGIVAGVGFVLVFVPVIFAMMFFITFLEATGYMARAAFVMDKLMHSIGLHGKSFIPLLMGFGCNVPSIYATRTLENQRDRILTSLLVPFMSCGARLPVYVLFISVFFPANGGLVLWIMYTLGIVMAVLLGLLLKNTLFKAESPVFIMELPPYRMPTMKHLMIHTWEKGKHFLIKAGTYILAVSVFVWFMLNLPWGVQDKKDSILGKTAQVVAPVFKPIGFGNWEATASLMTGVIAKEIVVGTMGEIYVHEIEEPQEIPTFREDVVHVFRSFVDANIQAVSNFMGSFGITSISAEDESGSSLKAVVRDKFSPLSAFAFMVFVLLYMPCVVTGVAYKQEFGSFKWYLVAIGLGFVTAYLSAFVVFQVGSFLAIGI